MRCFICQCVCVVRSLLDHYNKFQTIFKCSLVFNHTYKNIEEYVNESLICSWIWEEFVKHRNNGRIYEEKIGNFDHLNITNVLRISS